MGWSSFPNLVRKVIIGPSVDDSPSEYDETQIELTREGQTRLILE